MKRLIVCIVCIVLFSFFVLPSYGASELEQTKYFVYSNKNIELINIVEFLSVSDEYTNCSLLGTVFLYKAEKYFAEYKNYEVVSEYKRFVELNKEEIIYQILLSQEDFQEVDFSSYNIDDDQKENLKHFFELLKTFKDESNFTKYFAIMKDYYNFLPEYYSYKEQVKKYIDDSSNFFGTTQEEVHILLCPTKLYKMYLFTNKMNENDKSKLFILASVNDNINGYLQFGSEELYRKVLTKKLPSLLSKKVYSENSMDEYYEYCMNNGNLPEQIAKAISISVYQTDFTKNGINDYLKNCSYGGQIYVEPIYNYIEEEYKLNRSIYEKYEDFCPTFFKRISEIVNGEQ
ncbi:MAG: hypothetical protein KAH01_03385 [Caldisericia bacterium]|nr:hypothetical protein [Caldisericia bacterium]